MPVSAAISVTHNEESSWRGFAPGDWCTSIAVRDFIVRNATGYAGDEKFLAGPTARTKTVWDKLRPYFIEEQKKGVLAADAKTPSTMLAHGPGYIEQKNEVVVGLQTDQPFKRAIFPWGGLRMVEAGLKAAGIEADPQVHEAFTKYRKTHNDGVFDAYTDEIRACRKSGIITGLPDAYGRGRIIGDYRRVALYGVARLIEAKQEERKQVDDMWPTDEIIRVREELSEQIRALQDLAEMGKRATASTSHGLRPMRRRRSSGLISAISAPSRRPTARRCRSVVSRHFWMSISNATLRKAGSPRRGHKSCGTSSFRSSESCASYARPITTRCSAAIHIGRPSASAVWTSMVRRW
jgi:hypothetical protein